MHRPTVRDAAVLAAIVVAGAAVRLWGIRFGLPHVATRPDEEFIVRVALGFFSGDYNPHFFQWPSLYFYVVHALARIECGVRVAAGWHENTAACVTWIREAPTAFFLSVRLISVACGVATIAVVHGLGRALFGRMAGLLAAFFVAFAYLHVRDSHFGVLDVPLTLLILLTVRFLIPPSSSSVLRPSFLFAGIAAGVATSIKYNAAAVGVVAIAAAVLGAQPMDRRNLRVAAGHLGIFAAASIATFLAGSPYTLLDAPAFLEGLGEQARHFTEGHGIAVRNGWWYHLSFSLRHGLGAPLLLAGVAGIITALLMVPARGIVFAAFPVVYFAAIGSGQTAFVRYATPLVPFFCIAAGLFVATSAAVAFARRPASWRSAAAWTIAAFGVAPSAVNVARLDAVLSRTDTRVLAAEWLRPRVTRGAIVYEAGAMYAQPHLAWPSSAERSYRFVQFDSVTGVFMSPRAELPAWIVVPDSSPRLYTRAPHQLRTILDEHYDLVQEFSAVTAPERESWFDRQDAFFMPFASLALRERPGPELRIYRRRLP